MGDQSIRSIVVAMHTTILLLTSAHYHGALAQERALSSVDQRRLRHRPLDTYTFEQERHQHQQQGQFREGHDKKRKQLQQRKQLLASSSSCDGSIGWHADMTNRDGCSDGGDDYPKEWLDNNNGEQEFMFFSTSGECCAALFKGKVDCKIYDHGCHQEISSLDNDQSMRSNDNDTKPTCFSIGWHIEMKYQLGCSDDDNLDDEWRKPGIKELMVFPTAEECCDTFFDNDSRDCQIYNSGCQREDDAAMIISLDNISCNAPWHPDFEAKVGCSNKENVPEDWTELFDSARACCEKYSVDGVCPARDMCSKTKDGVMHYLSGPTRPPTMRPTQQPTTVEEWQKKYYSPPLIDSPEVGDDDDIDFFLLSGQSNAHGHTTSGLSIGEDDSYWMKIKSILESGGELDIMEELLYDAIYAANADHPEPGMVATTLANETTKLYKNGLLYDLDTPLSLGSCSFLVPLDWNAVNDHSGGTKPTVWNANCGGSFGHELMFSRALELEMGHQNRFEVVKNAHDGTEIHEYWYPDNGKYWYKLQSSIRSRKGYGNWKGFIWHQGIQDSLKKKGVEDTSLTYLGNLTGLIAEVRAEMFDASEGAWQCKQEIPVVVVQIGYWPQNDRAQRVREAQVEYCDGDPRAELAIMDDLSRFYHFDAPSFLISGHRIAQAYRSAVHRNVTCPSTSAPNSSSLEGPIAAGLTSSTSTRSPLSSPHHVPAASSTSPAPSSSSTSDWEEQS